MCDMSWLENAGASDTGSSGGASIDTGKGSGFDSANWGGGGDTSSAPEPTSSGGGFDFGSLGAGDTPTDGSAFNLGGGGGTPEDSLMGIGGIGATGDAGANSVSDIVPTSATTAATGAATPEDSLLGVGGVADPNALKPESSPIGDALGKLTKYGPLAAQGANLLMNRNAGQKYANEFKDIGSTQSGVATQMIQQAQAGQINPSDQASIDSWKAQQKAQTQAYYAKAGLSDSSMAQQAMAQIDQQANTMHEEARTKLLQTGMNALNITDQNQVRAVNAEISADKTAGTNMSNFMNTYAQWLRANQGG